MCRRTSRGDPRLDACGLSHSSKTSRQKGKYLITYEDLGPVVTGLVTAGKDGPGGVSVRKALIAPDIPRECPGWRSHPRQPAAA